MTPRYHEPERLYCFTKTLSNGYTIDMESTIKKRAVLDLIGATCTSCAITIEHVGRKVEGITDIFVDRGTSTIQIEYDGNAEALERIVDLVDKIGYEASIKATD